jgi:hypothetical protein
MIKALEQKLNVHWVIEGRLRQILVFLNRLFVTQCESEIDFSNEHQPHITILRGYALDEDEVRARFADFARQLAPIQFRLGAPYQDPRGGRYVFMDPADPIPFIQAKLRAQTAISSILRPSTNGGASNPPHLSLAYVRRNCSMPQDAEFYSSAELFVVNRIALSRCGDHGTCIGQIAAVDV